MNSHYVIAFRTKEDIDIIGLIVSDRDGLLEVEHPHFVKYNPATNSLMMMPYCYLTDQTLFEFQRQDLKFVVSASEQVALKFLKLLDTSGSHESISDFDHPQEDIRTVILEGNSTKH